MTSIGLSGDFIDATHQTLDFNVTTVSAFASTVYR